MESDSAVEKGTTLQEAEYESKGKSVDSDGSEKVKAPAFVPFNYLSGWRLHLSTAALYVSLFLVNFEVSVVSTALVGITDDLEAFSQGNWIVTAYLVAYTAWFVVWAKLSDIFGRRQTLIAALLVFTVFSGACGASQNIVELAVFRSFQGIGGAGTYAISIIICFELVPPRLFPKYTGLISTGFALSYGLGPLVGGAVSSNTSWIWVFLLNVPAGVLTGILLLISLPADFPHQGNHPGIKQRQGGLLQRFTKLDLIGSALLIGASVLIIVGVEQAGTEYAWSSTLVLACIIISGAFWILFGAWEWWTTSRNTSREPVLPFRLLQHRHFIGLLLNSFFCGCVYTIVIVQIPQRFQAANGTSPFEAGVRLLPLVFVSPVGSVTGSILAKTKVQLVYTLLIAAALQVVGVSLLSTLPTATNVEVAQYGYQVITGFGLGLSISTILLLVPVHTERRDQSVAMGAIYQLRALGGSVGLAIVTTVLNGFVKSQLQSQLPETTVSKILRSAAEITSLPGSLQSEVRGTLATGYNTQMKVVIGLAAAEFVSTLLILGPKNLAKAKSQMLMDG